MLSHISGNTFHLENVFIQSIGTTAGILEYQGPIGSYFDIHYPDHHFGHSSYELAEIAMLQDSINVCLEKVKLTVDKVDIYFGGDLNNQITATNYYAKNINRPLVGIYSACSTLGLAIASAAIMINNQAITNAVAFTVSHNATAERQFRYPIEYGVQRKETMTFTATGACSVLLSSKPNQIKISNVTIGRVVDLHQNNPNDMGRAMAPAAFDTLMNHLKDLDIDASYYDLIISGDLSRYGKKIMKELLHQSSVLYNKYDDCGCILYDSNQDVQMGGSGPVCSGLVTFGYIYKKMLEGKYHRVLVLTTGALLSPVMTNQKQSIPCICHAFSLEVV